MENISKDDLDVMVVTYNRAELLRIQLESLCLQTIRGLNIIIVDNASTDNTRDVVEQMRNAHPEHTIRLERASRHSDSNAESFRRTQQLAERPYVAVFHDDDVIHPQYIEKVLSVLTRVRGVVGVSCNYKAMFCCDGANWTAVGDRCWAYPQHLAPYLYLAGGRFCFAAMVYRTDVYKQLEIDPERYGKLFDNAMLLSLSQKGTVVKFRDPMIRYRLHAGSDSSNPNNAPTVENLVNLLSFAQNVLNSCSGWPRFFSKCHVYEYGREIFAWSKLANVSWNQFRVKCADAKVSSDLFSRCYKIAIVRRVMRHLVKRVDSLLLRTLRNAMHVEAL